MGGYLSRISRQRAAQLRGRPVRAALIALSERRDLDERVATRARRAAGEFIEQGRLGYVVIDRSRATPQLRDFAIALFDLQRVETSGVFELYVPGIVKAGR